MNKTYSKLTYGLYLVSSTNNGKDNGCIVNTVIQVTSKPERLSVTVSKNNLTHDLILKSNLFNAAILSIDTPMELIGNFGFHSGNDIDKFANYNAKTDVNGVKYIEDHMVALFSCKVISSIDVGTHTIFIGDVIEDRSISEDKYPITYAYYHMVKKGKIPRNSPSYREGINDINESAVNEKGLQCGVCGHIEEVESLPEDYRCPICGNDRSVFTKL